MANRRLALVVAVDRYRDPQLRRLRAPGHDAKALASVLADPAIGGFEVTVLHNDPEHVIRHRIDALFSDRSPTDTILLHFACHGIKDEDGRLHFAATGTERHHLASTAVSAEFVCQRMDHSRSRQILLFLDCCYSGAISREMSARDDTTVHVGEEFAGDGRGRVIITASSAIEYAFEGGAVRGSPRTSVFTTAMVRGLRTGDADLNGDGYVTTDELYDYLYEQVRASTPLQTPAKWDFVQGDIVVARSPRGPRPGTGPTEDIAWRPDEQAAQPERVSPVAPPPGLDIALLERALSSRAPRAIRAARRHYLEAAASPDPETAAAAALGLARLARHLDDRETAITWYRRGWAQGRTGCHTILAVELADLLAAGGETADAGWFYRWVLDSGPSPEAAAAAVGLGDLLEAGGKLGAAQQLYRRVLTMVGPDDPSWPAALGRISAATSEARIAVMNGWLTWLTRGFGEWVLFADESDDTRYVEFFYPDAARLAVRVSGTETRPGGERRVRGPAFVAALVGRGFRLDLSRWPDSDDLVKYDLPADLAGDPAALAAYADDLLIRALGARSRFTLAVTALSRPG